jgi:hypothetical protein
MFATKKLKIRRNDQSLLQTIKIHSSHFGKKIVQKIEVCIMQIYFIKKGTNYILKYFDVVKE